MYNKDKIIRTMKEIKTESDEIKPFVCICQPRRDLNETPAQKLEGYEGLHIDMLGYSHGFVNIGGEKVDSARNYLIERAIESGSKYMLFVGEDTVFPYDGFLKLLETSRKNPRDMIVGVYYIKCSSAMVMVREGNFIYPANVDPDQEPFEIWQAGLDSALVPIETLIKIKESDPEIPFCCIGHPSVPGLEDIPFIGEDNFFYYRLRQCGFKVICDPRVQCLHVDLASGKYSAHPSVKLNNYYTNIPITDPLTLDDKAYIDNRWSSRIPGEKNKIQEEVSSNNKK